MRRIVFLTLLIVGLSGCLLIGYWLSRAADEKENPEIPKLGIPNSSIESELNGLIFEGPELHESLATRPMDDTVRHLAAGLEMPQNPYVTDEAKYVRAISGSGSQGRLNEKGVRAVLYSLYVDERELGFYGIEAESELDADRREGQLREIWARNVELNRASVHRGGLVILVIWTDGVTAECWKAVNRKVAERLKNVSHKN